MVQQLKELDGLTKTQVQCHESTIWGYTMHSATLQTKLSCLLCTISNTVLLYANVMSTSGSSSWTQFPAIELFEEGVHYYQGQMRPGGQDLIMCQLRFPPGLSASWVSMPHTQPPCISTATVQTAPDTTPSLLWQTIPLKPMSQARQLVMHAFDPSTWVAAAGGSLNLRSG